MAPSLCTHGKHTMSNVLGEAIDFMDAGYRAFGLYGAEADGSCACGNPICEAPYKHPRNANWQICPEWSDEQLEGLEAIGHFDTGYGVLVKGLLVVDVDARNGGVESYAKLCKDLDLDLTHNCGLAVQTGSGHGSMHVYYKAPAGVSMVQSHKDYPGIDFKSSGFCVGPGSMHASGNRYVAIIGSPSEIGEAPDSLVKLITRAEAYRSSDSSGQTVDVTDNDLRRMLSFISCDCPRSEWVAIGMALHEATGGTGFDLWDSWSSSGSTYPGPGDLLNQWTKFGKSTNPVTLGTLIHHAKAAGWEPEPEEAVEFAPGTWMARLAAGDAVKQVDEVEEEVATKDNKLVKLKSSRPFLLDGVDLQRPPGFVGELTKWVNGQSRFPRENLAVGTAIQAVGNIAGLRYTDDMDGVTTNLFMMCVAGSATGKEAIMQSINYVMAQAGMARATVGSIKSEQEIIRNLLDNQAANYVIDELGILLKTITQSKEAYHAGVIGALMNAYSKANSYMPLNGDTKRDVRKTLSGELASARKMLDENEGDAGRLERRVVQLERALKSIDNGLEAPFLSLIGFTTPITFESLVTYEQATNGFIGRSIIIEEKDSNPKAKRNYKADVMTDRMRLTLMGMYDGGTYDSENYRVEYYGEREKIPSTQGAKDMLDQVADWSWNLAEQHRHTTGLESIPRRAREMVSKLSLILAVPGRLRTEEHVRWAFAFVERDIRNKCLLANSNRMEQILEKSTTENAGLQAMRIKLNARLDPEEWETVGALKNKIGRGKEGLFDMAISSLEAEGRIEVEEYKAGHNGKTARRVRLKGERHD